MNLYDLFLYIFCLAILIIWLYSIFVFFVPSEKRINSPKIDDGETEEDEYQSLQELNQENLAEDEYFEGEEDNESEEEHDKENNEEDEYFEEEERIQENMDVEEYYEEYVEENGNNDIRDEKEYFQEGIEEQDQVASGRQEAVSTSWLSIFGLESESKVNVQEETPQSWFTSLQEESLGQKSSESYRDIPDSEEDNSQDEKSVSWFERLTSEQENTTSTNDDEDDYEEEDE